jgi:hypothetical protein
MANSQPDSNSRLNLEVVGPLLLQLRDNLLALSLGLQDVLFELDVERQRESSVQVDLILERAKVSSLGARSKPG